MPHCRPVFRVGSRFMLPLFLVQSPLRSPYRQGSGPHPLVRFRSSLMTSLFFGKVDCLADVPLFPMAPRPPSPPLPAWPWVWCFGHPPSLLFKALFLFLLNFSFFFPKGVDESYTLRLFKSPPQGMDEAFC